MFERVLGPPTDPAALSQERTQPARRNVHPRVLLQVDGQPLRGPDVKGKAQLGRWGLQRGFHGGHIGGIRLHGPAGAGRIRQCTHAPVCKARQPVLHPGHRASTPARDALDVVAQGGGFGHLQPFAHPSRQIRAPQLPLHCLTLFPSDGDAHGAAPHSSVRVAHTHPYL